MNSQITSDIVKQNGPTPKEAKERVLKFAKKFAGIERRAGNYAGACAIDAIARAIQAVPVESTHVEKVG